MARAYQHQHFAEAPRGWRVRSKRSGEHVLRVAFPPGRRRRGAGRLLEILHPKRNPACENGECPIAQNPAEELLIFNPSRRELQRKARERAAAIRGARLNGGIGNHKPGCKCAFCEHARKVREMVEKMPKPIRDVFDRNPSQAKAAKLFRRMEDLLAQGKIKASNRLRIRLARINKQMGWTMADVAGFNRARGTNPRGRESSQDRRRRSALRRRNQPDGDLRQAVTLFQKFHGRDPEEIAEAQESAVMRLEYATLGDLEYLITQPTDKPAVKICFDEDDDVKLASAPNGRQLYAIDGNQNLSSMLGKFTDDPSKDFIDLGEGLEVQYLARKIHGRYEPTSYFHKFGEKNGALPRLMYDRLKKRIFFVGGEYFIDTRDAVSPGIEN